MCDGFIWSLALPVDHGAKPYRDIMELDVYMELSIPGDHEASHLYGAMNTGRSWS